MITTILGGSASGKSEYAENLCLRAGEKKLYVATMEPFGKEALERIENHKEMRKHKGFDTLEKYSRLYECEIENQDVILLECMSTLVANEYFTNQDYEKSIKEGILNFKRYTDNLVVITNNIFADGIVYEEETMKYMRVLGELNRWLANESDTVIDVVFGIPVFKKTSCI